MHLSEIEEQQCQMVELCSARELVSLLSVCCGEEEEEEAEEKEEEECGGGEERERQIE